MLHQVHPQVVLRAMHLVVGTCKIAKSTLLALLTIFHRVDGPTGEKCNLYLQTDSSHGSQEFWRKITGFYLKEFRATNGTRL